MNEKAWNRYYQMNIAFEVKKERKVKHFYKVKVLRAQSYVCKDNSNTEIM